MLKSQIVSYLSTTSSLVSPLYIFNGSFFDTIYFLSVDLYVPTLTLYIEPTSFHINVYEYCAIFDFTGFSNSVFGLLYPSYTEFTGIFNDIVSLPNVSYASYGYTTFMLYIFLL